MGSEIESNTVLNRKRSWNGIDRTKGMHKSCKITADKGVSRPNRQRRKPERKKIGAG